MKRLFSIILVVVMLTLMCAVSVNATTAPAGTLGDVNDDGDVDILDATQVQLMVANLCEYDEEDELYADVDLDREVSILDATEIQLWLAGLLKDSKIESWYNYDMYEDDFYYDYLSGSAVKGVPVTFTANVRAGSPMQNYELYVNDELVASSETSNSLTYTFPQAGTYKICMLANAFYRTGAFSVSEYVVQESDDEELKFKAFYSTGKHWGSFVWGQKDMKFHAEGMGGVAPYQYEFVMEHPNDPDYYESPMVYVTQEYSDKNYFELPAYRFYDIFDKNDFYGSLECKITVRIKDANGDVVETEKQFWYDEPMIG